MKVTSAYANKYIRQMDEEKQYWTEFEEANRTYVASEDEKPFIPEYDFNAVNQKITEINDRICQVKHAINVANATTCIPVDGFDGEMSIDQILVRLAMLSSRKFTLDHMRKQQPVTRLELRMRSRHLVPEFRHLNYELDDAAREYELLSSQILSLQMALDKHNQTFEFDI